MEFVVPEGFVEISPLPPVLRMLGPFYIKRIDGQTTQIGYRTTAQHQRTPQGHVGGGILLNLCDFAIGYVVGIEHFGSMKGVHNIATISLNTDFIASPKINEWLVTEVDVLRVGNRVGFGQCIVKSDDRIVCRASANFAIIELKPV
jgi:acyl-coenzyme A thioesterase PaaI-like protein